MEWIIKNACVGGQLLDIAVDGGKIADMGKNLDYNAEHTYDAKGGITVPGLVDCHAHIDKSHLNEQSPYVPGTGPEKGALTRGEKAKFTVENITRRAELVIGHAIKTGTLALRTNVDVDGIVGLKGIEALLALRDKYKDTLHLQIAAFAQEGIFQDGKTPELLEEALNMGANLVGGHTITGGEGEKHIDFILDLACKYKVEADFHLDESGSRQHYLLPYLARQMQERGLQGRVNGIHMCTLAALTEEELEEALALLKSSGLKATIAPTAIATRQVAPVKKLLAAGVPVGLGSDNVRDFFNPLGCGDIKQMALLLSYLQAFYTAGEVDSVWRMITEAGAEILGIDYGIKVGGAADVTVFPADNPAEVIASQVQPDFILRKGISLPMGR